MAFRQVMEGRPVAAQDSWLFLMPAEIHEHIFGFVADDKNDLATLALVNSDCRQIARSYQFRAVTFTSSFQCEEGILALLQREAIERRQDRGDYGMTRKPSLGVCIRRVTATEGGLNMWMNANKPGRQSTFAEQRKWRFRLPRVIEHLNQVYRPAVLSVIASLPHLDAARILRNSKAGGLVLNEHLLNCLTGSTLRTLELRVTMEGRCPQVVDGVSWPLETLDLRLEWDHHEHISGRGPGPGPGAGQLDASAYCDSILRLCCANLERLCICLPPLRSSMASECPTFFFLQFPRLRRLDTLDAGNLHPLALRSLLTTSRCLSALSIDYTLRHVQEFLGRMGPAMPALEVLILRYQALYQPGEQHDLPLPLPARPRHGRGGAAAASRPRVVRLPRGVLGRLVPVLSRCPRLRRLSMTFEDAYVPDSQLEVLAGLGGDALVPRLEELHLGAGPTGTPRAPRWLVDHGDVRRVLSSGGAAGPGRGPGRGLKKLVLSGDAYLCGGGGGAARRYCTLETPISREHCRLMRREALEYARVLPRLEFVYIGTLSFWIVRVGDEVAIRAEEYYHEFDPVEGW